MAGVSWRVMHERLESVNLIEETKPIVEDTGHKIVAKVKEQLYETGTDKFGKQLQRYKNTAYAKKKNQMNPKPGYGVPDFYLRGNLHQGLQVEAGARGYDVYSNVSYFKYVERRDGEKAFDMNDPNRNQYRRDTLYPRLRKAIKQKTKTR